MVEPIVINLRYIAQEVELHEDCVEAVIQMLDAGLPVPFIARYRRDETGNLHEEKIRIIETVLKEYRQLAERKMTILKSIDSQNKLTPELDDKIRTARNKKRLEDLYTPFKPKKQTLASKSREKGLEPLALEIYHGTVAPEKLDERAADFINPDKKVESVADALLGAGYILSELFADTAELIQVAREHLHTYGELVTEQITEPKQELPTAKPAQVAELEVETVPGIAVDESEAVDENDDANESEDANGTGDEAVDESETLETPDSAAPEQEITEAFQAIQQAQLEEKGAPVVISQNTLKKRKKEEEKKKLEAIRQRNREHFTKQFTDYYQFSTRLRGIPAHRILAINRGESAKVIKAKIVIDLEQTLQAVRHIVVPQEHVHSVFLTGCLKDALHRLIIPALEREVRNDMTDYAEEQAIKSFGRNLRHLLLQPPVYRKRVLAIDPGFKHGCKTVAIDEFGNLLAFETIFMLGGGERKVKAGEKLAELIKQYNIDVIAVGNGTGSREATELTAQVLKDNAETFSNVSFVVVNEAGASVYSASPAAAEEFPNHDPLVRGAVSIGRRLQDPLNELVKIEPQSIGVGMYQHDIKSKALKEQLGKVVESCVNFVGVDLNTATPAVLTHIAGLNQLTARKIYEYRREHGPFRNRADLKSVSGFGTAAFTYAAGFLKIPDAANPLDATRIHPESYELASHVLGKLGFTAEDLRDKDKVQAITDRIATEKFGEWSANLATELGTGVHTIRDILDELRRPGRDPRDNFPPPVFRKNVLQIEDLTAGLELTATVLNVVDFGAFLDIGLHESGFVHISQMSTGYLRDAHERLAVGDIVTVWVVAVDSDRKRVTCTMLPPGTVRDKPDEYRQKTRSETKERPQKRPVQDTRPPKKPSPEVPRIHQDRFKVKRNDKPFNRDAGSDNGNREPKVFVAKAEKNAVQPITDKQKRGKEALRSFGDLAQLMGIVTVSDPVKEKERLKEEARKQREKQKQQDNQSSDGG